MNEWSSELIWLVLRWFSSLLGKYSSVAQIVALFKKHSVSSADVVGIIDPCQLMLNILSCYR